jgi:hypothetical protein
MGYFTFAVQILMIKPTRYTNFSNLCWNETLHVSDSSSVHHQEFFTVHTVVGDTPPATELNQFHPDPARQLSTNLHDIRVYHRCVYSEKLLMMDRGILRNMKSFIPK